MLNNIKLLSILLLSFFWTKTSYAQSIDTLQYQDFELTPITTNPVWSFSGPVIYNQGVSGATAAPPNSPIGIGGSRAWETVSQSSGLTLDFANTLNPGGYDSLAIEFKLAAMNLNGSSGGPDNLDYVNVAISTDGGSTYYTRVRIQGAVSNNSFWEYSATGLAYAYYLPTTQLLYQPINSGLATTMGYSTIRIAFPSTVTQVALRITGRSSSSGDSWLVDNVALLGYVNCTSNAGFSNTTSTICGGDSVLFTNSSSGATGYEWRVNGALESTTTNFNRVFNTPGTYTVELTASNGTCSTTQTEIITVNTAVQITANATAVDCFGGNDGSLAVIVNSGTTPYNYLWSNGATTNLVNNVAGGTYSLSVTDANGCSATTGGLIVSEPSTAILISQISTTDISCFNGTDGTATIAGMGGTIPYTYLWSNGATSSMISALSALAYQVSITDANGCMVDSILSINEPNSPLENTLAGQNSSTNQACDGTIMGSPTGGTPTYNFLWNNGETSQDLSGLCEGTYMVTLTDNNGCMLMDTIIIASDSIVSIGFTASESKIKLFPNPSKSDLIYISGLSGEGYIHIYDALGRKVYSRWSPAGSELRELYVGNLPEGLYFIQIMQNEKQLEAFRFRHMK